MKKLIPFLLLTLLIVTPAYPFGPAIQAVVGSGGAAAPASYKCTDATHDSANNAITVCEDAEGSVDCDAGAGTQEFCRSGWTLAGTPVFNATGIEDNYSIDLNSTVAATNIYKSIASADNYYMFLEVQVVALPTVSAKILGAFNASGSSKGLVQINTDGTLRVANGTDGANTTDAVSAGGTYYVWMGYNKGTGIDGFGYVAFSSNMTRPTSGNKYKEVTAGNANSAINRILFGSTSTSPAHYVIDHIRVNTSDFGSNVP